MNQDAINADLGNNSTAESKMQTYVLRLVKDYVKNSSSAIAKYYDRWTEYDNVYRGYRLVDKDDAEASAKNEPTKVIVPISFAQTQTAIAFLLSSFSQRPRFFEFSGMNPEDQNSAEAISIDIEYQMQHNKWLYLVYCDLLATMKYGFAPVKCSWTTEKKQVRTRKPVSAGPLSRALSMFGLPQEQRFEETVEEVTSYEGNKIINISPYNFFPDPSVTIANFQDGRFVGHEELTSLAKLQEDLGSLYFGVEKIEPLKLDQLDKSPMRTRVDAMQEVKALSVAAGDKKVGVSSVVLTEVQFKVAPKSLSEKTGFDFGDETNPVVFIAVYANDNKLIRLERANYLHGQFTYAVGEFSPDHTSFYNPGLSDVIYELQSLTSFFLNSHVQNVKKIIKNQFIVDPEKVNLEDLKNSAYVIRLKQSGLPIDRVLQQLTQMDVTSRHVGDMETLLQLVQMVTGINENALGQYAGGRRSATEARNVSAGAATRLKMLGQLLWTKKYVPLGDMMMSNTRQGRSKEVYQAIIGSNAEKYPFENVILAKPGTICGGYFVTPYDGTLPSDRQFQAGLFKELFTAVMSKPEVIPVLGLDPAKLLTKIAELHGIYNLGSFSVANKTGAQPAQIVPDEVAMAAAQSGSAVPTEQNPEALLQALGQNGQA
jgi:hypothetical protein